MIHLLRDTRGLALDSTSASIRECRMSRSVACRIDWIGRTMCVRNFSGNASVGCREICQDIISCPDGYCPPKTHRIFKNPHFIRGILWNQWRHVTIVHTCSHRREAISHTLMVLSADAEKRRSPLTTTAHTISSCPCRMLLGTLISSALEMEEVVVRGSFIAKDTPLAAAHSCYERQSTLSAKRHLPRFQIVP